MSYALRIPDFFKAPPGGGIKPPFSAPKIPPIKPPGGLGAGIIGVLIYEFFDQILFPPPTARDALDEIGFKPFFYQPPTKKKLQPPPFSGGQESNRLYQLTAAAHGDNQLTTPYNPLQPRGSSIYGKINKIRIDVSENGEWLIDVPNPYQPIQDNPNGTQSWRNVNWRLWANARAQPFGDYLDIQVDGAVTPSIKFGNPVRVDGQEDDSGDPPTPETSAPRSCLGILTPTKIK